MGKDIYVFIDQHNKPYSYDLVIDDKHGLKMAEEKGHQYCGIFNTKHNPLILNENYEFKFNRSYTSKINYRELNCPLFLPFDYSTSFGDHSSSFKFTISVPSKFGVNTNINVVLDNGLSNQLWGKTNSFKFKVVEKNDLIYFVFLDDFNNQINKAIPLKIVGA